MALDSIVVGCDWAVSLVVEPTEGKTATDITNDLTSATVTASVYDSSDAIVTAAVASVSSPSNRTISVSIAKNVTALLSPRPSCFLEVRVTTSGGTVMPIAVRDLVDVRAFASGERIPGTV